MPLLNIGLIGSFNWRQQGMNSQIGSEETRKRILTSLQNSLCRLSMHAAVTCFGKIDTQTQHST
jgi:hypothetical protein